MQVEYKDGSKGDVITADTVEELIPNIKKALENPYVKCVRIFNYGSRIQAEEDRKTNAEQMMELLEDVNPKSTKKVKLTIPKRR